MKCEICGGVRITEHGKPGGLDCPGVCLDCRDDADLGHLLNSMIQGEAFITFHRLPGRVPVPGYGVTLCSRQTERPSKGDTCLDALKEAVDKIKLTGREGEKP